MKELQELFTTIRSIPDVSLNLRLVVDGQGAGLIHAKAADIRRYFLHEQLDAYTQGDRYIPTNHANLLNELVRLAVAFNTSFKVYAEPETRMGLTKICISQDKVYAFNFCEYLTTVEGWNALIDNVRKQLNDTVPTVPGISKGN